jgi:hypothetical protein
VSFLVVHTNCAISAFCTETTHHSLEKVPWKRKQRAVSVTSSLWFWAPGHAVSLVSETKVMTHLDIFYENTGRHLVEWFWHWPRWRVGSLFHCAKMPPPCREKRASGGGRGLAHSLGLFAYLFRSEIWHLLLGGTGGKRKGLCHAGKLVLLQASTPYDYWGSSQAQTFHLWASVLLPYVIDIIKIGKGIELSELAGLLSALWICVRQAPVFKKR